MLLKTGKHDNVSNSNTSNIHTNVLLSKQDLKDVIKTLIHVCTQMKFYFFTIAIKSPSFDLLLP